MTAVIPRQYWGGHTDTEATDPADEDWIQLHASEWAVTALGHWHLWRCFGWKSTLHDR
jgi:hypothetical protein